MLGVKGLRALGVESLGLRVGMLGVKGLGLRAFWGSRIQKLGGLDLARKFQQIATNRFELSRSCWGPNAQSVNTRLRVQGSLCRQCQFRSDNDKLVEAPKGKELFFWLRV